MLSKRQESSQVFFKPVQILAVHTNCLLYLPHFLAKPYSRDKEFEYSRCFRTNDQVTSKHKISGIKRYSEYTAPLQELVSYL